MTTQTDAIIAAADSVRTAHLAALRPLAEVAGRTAEHAPIVEASLAAALHLIAEKPALDHAITELLRELIAAGISHSTLARLMNIRRSTLTDRLAAPAPTAVPAPEVHSGMFRPKDEVSRRAARESMIGAAHDLGLAYATALRPISTVSQGLVPEAATVDSALEAVLHLHASRTALAAALDRVLACLVLGGVRRMSLAAALGVRPHTLQRRLIDQPLAHARWADLRDEGNGKWSATRAEVGRYKSTEELDPAVVQAAVAEAITGIQETGGGARA
ncbi:hypothetical protein BKG58_19940 [Mycobacteroides abscessus subsp. abscessus]|uniref:hypothetical protein n=1 Tax=Mycobacteroides abscessus TaxID=36809 RepID=UPI00034C7FFD|nr:hypothetical protein [Mycobacteroides abscessus]OLT79702.1 hypothetical protein BKG58_19940 [Mycobacteroides abscessus subsp. abscessus]SHP95673.1 Uncharacterised protein [Mycobacteroides abscessus subsp. abscessus]SKO07081.1 Uncharacterised protein [Mycobacteroides abscessus subsp. abscessus]